MARLSCSANSREAVKLLAAKHVGSPGTSLSAFLNADGRRCGGHALQPEAKRLSASRFFGASSQGQET